MIWLVGRERERERFTADHVLQVVTNWYFELVISLRNAKGTNSCAQDIYKNYTNVITYWLHDIVSSFT